MFWHTKPLPLPKDHLEIVQRALDLEVVIADLKKEMGLLKENLTLMEEGMAYMVRHAAQANAVMENHANAITALAQNGVPDDERSVH